MTAAPLRPHFLMPINVTYHQPTVTQAADSSCADLTTQITAPAGFEKKPTAIAAGGIGLSLAVNLARAQPTA
jgi:hypothetical protein